MSSVQGSLLRPSDIRRLRQSMTERELLARCRDAARLELRGARYSREDREDVAAQILAEGLAATHGVLPSKNDRTHSLTAYCGKAKNRRRSIDAERSRDEQAAVDAADDAAQSVWALAADFVPAPEPTSTLEAAEMADEAQRRLLMADRDDTDIWTLLYRMVRDLPTAQIANDLDVSPNAIDLRTARGRRKLRAAYPDAAELLADLVGDPIAALIEGEPTLIFSREDRSTEATTHGKTWGGKALRDQSGRWREGTDAGRWPERPADSDAANAACTLRRLPGGRRKHRDADAQATADALRNLGMALAA